MAAPLSDPAAEEQFDCFGGTCTVIVIGAGLAASATEAAQDARRRLLAWHRHFSRFERTSELSRLNRDNRERVPVSSMMARFVEAALDAAALTGGLVDPTLVPEVERAGYTHDLGPGYAPPGLLGLPGPRRPAGPSSQARWRAVTVDRRTGVVTRPLGLRLDCGGIAKGLFGDVLAGSLSHHPSFVVAAGGDVRLGGAAGTRRSIHVTSPFADGEILHTFELARGAVATSGTTRRSWIDERGLLSHHLIDPASGTPAFTGVVQATAIAPTGVLAEARAKAALLSGPEHAALWLPDGGVVAYDDGTYEVIGPAERRAAA